MEDQIPHKRRVRYKGTHPKKFSEKYKEHNPDKYAETVERVKQKGSTPAGMHISICVEEILEFLNIQPGQIGLDATLGYGGHSTEMLKCLKGEGHLYALDVDPIERVKTKQRLEQRGFGEELVTVIGENFANIAKVSKDYDTKFDFILADLGVSSMQIDNPDRGFTYKFDGPLDLRLDPSKGESAADRLKDIAYDELYGMLMENADEVYADEISRAIINKKRKGVKIETTKCLREIIEEALNFLPPRDYDRAVKKACQRTFQALRIDVNSEFEVLESFLESLPDVLAPDGKVAILTFHSGEDRLVKKAFKRLFTEGVYKEIAKDVIRPSDDECRRNGRAKCTKMRWAIKG